MQDYLAISIAVIAAAFLAYRGWQRLANRRSGTCGSCASCPSNASDQTPPLVNLSSDMSHAKAPRR